MPQPACDAAVFCIQGKQLYPAEHSGGITHHWCHGSPDTRNVLFYFPSRKFEWQTSGDNGRQMGLIDSMTGIRPTVLIWDDSSSLSIGDVVEIKLWCCLDGWTSNINSLKPEITDCSKLQKLNCIHIITQNSLEANLTALSEGNLLSMVLRISRHPTVPHSRWSFGHTQGQYQW